MLTFHKVVPLLWGTTELFFLRTWTPLKLHIQKTELDVNIIELLAKADEQKKQWNKRTSNSALHTEKEAEL